MAFKLVWSDEALEDIESIATYIEKDSPVYAKSVVTKFFEKVEILVDNPKLGRMVPEMDNENIREIFVYSYRLIYELKANSIMVIAIIHGRRLIENHN